jgi:DNA-binding response OmpR family regulator
MTQDRKALGKLALKRSPGESGEDPEAELEALRALSEQYGVPGIDLNQVCIRLQDLELLPREIAERRLILPVLVRDDRVFVAMTNPADKKVVDELEFVTGKRVFPYVALQSALVRVIAAAYDGKMHGEAFYVGPLCPTEIQRKMGALSEEEPEPLAAASSYPDAPEASLSPENTEDDNARLSYSDFGDVDPDLSVVEQMPTAPKSGAARPEADALAGPPRTVLVVDDEPDIRKLLVRVLGSKGFKVFEADRGLEALRMVKAHMPDLLVLDAMLPEVHGFEIARRIRGSAKYGHIPIVMISAVYKGWRFAEDAKTSYGVDAYIEKPFRIGDVVAAIESVLANPRPAGAHPVSGGAVAAPSAAPEPPRDPNAVSADAERYLNAGVAAYQAGDIDKAIAHLKQGVAIDPLAFRLHFHLGLLHGKKGQVYEAIQELERAVEQNAQHFPAIKNLAVLYQKSGFRNKAVEAWERAVRVAPDDATRESIKQHLLSLL